MQLVSRFDDWSPDFRRHIATVTAISTYLTEKYGESPDNVTVKDGETIWTDQDGPPNVGIVISIRSVQQEGEQNYPYGMWITLSSSLSPMDDVSSQVDFATAQDYFGTAWEKILQTQKELIEVILAAQ